MKELYVKNKFKLSCSILFILLIIEIISSCKQGIFSTTAALVYYGLAYSLLGYVLYEFIKTIKNDIKNKSYLSLIGFIIVISFYLFFVFTISYGLIHIESEQEMRDIMNLSKTSDFGYNGIIYGKYPARELILSSPIVLLFGRSVLTLRLCFAVLFIVGIIRFYIGLKHYLEYKSLNSKYAFIPLISLLIFPYIHEYFNYFEQSMLPVSILMILIGVFLDFYIDNNKFVHYLEFIFIVNYLGHSYYTNLAILGLTLVIFLFIIISNSIHKPCIVILSSIKSIILLSICTIYGIISYLVTNYDESTSDIAWDQIQNAPKSIIEFLFNEHSLFFSFMGIVFIGYFILSICFKLSILDFLITGWSFAVMITALYVNRHYEEFSLYHRITIIIPIIITMIFIHGYNFIIKYDIKVSKILLYVYMILCLISGVYFTFHLQGTTIFADTIETVSYTFAEDYLLEVTDKFDLRDKDIVIFYTPNLSYYWGYSNHMEFFYPNCKPIRFD